MEKIPLNRETTTYLELLRLINTYKLKGYDIHLEMYGLTPIFEIKLLRHNHELPIVVNAHDITPTGLERAELLLAKVKALEMDLKHAIPSPSSSDQPYPNGYFSKVFRENAALGNSGPVASKIEVQFQRSSAHTAADLMFSITGVNLIDKLGFYYADAPFKIVPDDWKLLTSTPPRWWPDGTIHFVQTVIASLKADEQLYAWNDIGALAGSAGLAVVKKIQVTHGDEIINTGHVIKTKGILRS